MVLRGFRGFVTSKSGVDDVYLITRKIGVMKSLQELKVRVRKFRFGRAQKKQEIQEPKEKKIITKSFSDDEDLFLFI